MATVMLKCSGSSGEFKVQPKPDVVTFATPASCAPLQSFKFGQAAPGFTLKGTNKDGSISYNYDGTPIPAAGYPFSYQTSEKAMGGNGTGVIKN